MTRTICPSKHKPTECWGDLVVVPYLSTVFYSLFGGGIYTFIVAIHIASSPKKERLTNLHVVNLLDHTKHAHIIVNWRKKKKRINK